MAAPHDKSFHYGIATSTFPNPVTGKYDRFDLWASHEEKALIISIGDEVDVGFSGITPQYKVAPDTGEIRALTDEKWVPFASFDDRRAVYVYRPSKNRTQHDPAAIL